MKYIFYGFMITLVLFMITVFLFGCDPIRIEYDPPEIIFPQFDGNIVNSEREYDEWVNTLDPNFVGSLGL